MLAVRDLAKGNVAASELEAQGFKGELLVWHLDVLRFSSVTLFSDRCETLDRIDCFVVVGSVVALRWVTTEDGWEST